MHTYTIQLELLSDDLTPDEIAELPDCITARLREVYVNGGEASMRVLSVTTN